MKSSLLKLLLAVGLLLGANQTCQAQLVREVSTNYSTTRILVKEWTYLSDGLKVKGLLFVPKSILSERGTVAKKSPVVVFCHDGISGVSKSHRNSSVRLAEMGYVVFSPSYRGEDSSEGTVEIAKGEVHDVLRAVDLLEKRPEVDPNKIALMGASHGSLISALAASRDSRIKAIVLAYGVMDIYRWWEHLETTNQVGKDEVTVRTYGDGPSDHPQSFKIRNAVDRASSIHCPVLILQGSKDTIVPPEQATYMKQALEKFGKDCQVEIYPDCLHGFLVYAPYLTHGVEAAEKRQAETAWKVTQGFLKRVFGS